MPSDRDALVAEVNRLYWETELPVTEMAERLGISRRTIYDMLIPTPAHERCPECGGALVYPNRSARMAGEAVCSACGRTQDVTLLQELAGEARPPAAQRPTGVAVRGPVGMELRRRVGGAVAERPPTGMAVMPRRPSPALITLLLGTLLVALVTALLVPARRRRRWW
jgi:hypothetical protein